MDEHINTAILGNYANNCENIEMRRPSSQGVLKGAENGSLQFMSREQEYIDHTLLGPEYISNTMSNSFIIDLMDQHDSAGQVPSECSISLNTNETFPSEALHTILQLVNRQEHNRIQPNESSTDHLVHHTDKDILESELLAMHGNLLNDPKFQLFYKQQNIPTQEALNQDVKFSQMRNLRDAPSPLALIRWPKNEQYDEPLEQMPDIVASLGTTAKKILPHKKRISKKLKILDRPEDLYQLDEESPSRIEPLVISNGVQFECEICGSISESQVQFFSHLKGHYEPGAMEVTKSIETSSIAAASDTSVIEKTTLKQESHLAVTGDRVLNEVELNFNSFSEVVGLSAQQQLMSDNQHEQNRNDMKILDSNTIAKCMGFVVQAPETNQACNGNGEVEFSDTEDMLEGIRGVVDKVSVDDTSDDLDMPPTSVSKESWFANSAFTELHYNEEERIENEPFRREPNLVPIPIEQLQNHAPERSQTPIIDISSIKMEDDEFNINDHYDDSTDDQDDSLNADISIKRKRGRPRGSKKKRKRVGDGKTEDESSNEMEEYTKRRYICPKCNREFNSCNALKYHDLSHTGHRPHQCDVCGKSFFAQSALKSHLRVHTGDKPYECEKCQRKFRQWSDLKYHNVSIHSDEKNYQCEFCGKSFSRKYSLVIHRRIHTSERNYKCEFCPKTFRASSYLQNHRKIHTGEKPYECGTCGKKFRVSGDLRRHSRTHERVRKSPSEQKTFNEKSTNQSKSCHSKVHVTVGCQKETKDNLIFLDKMASRMDHLFKTETANVNANVENMNLSFVT